MVEYKASQLPGPNRSRGSWGAGPAVAEAGNEDKARYHRCTRVIEAAGSVDARPELAKAGDYFAMKYPLSSVQIGAAVSVAGRVLWLEVK